LELLVQFIPFEEDALQREITRTPEQLLHRDDAVRWAEAVMSESGNSEAKTVTGIYAMVGILLFLSYLNGSWRSSLYRLSATQHSRWMIGFAGK